MEFPTIEQCIGNTPLVRLQRLGVNNNSTVLVKLEGNNPAGSVKDRPALSMIKEAEKQGLITPGDTLIEATSGNTGIALAMVAAIKGYNLILVMPDNVSEERKMVVRTYGAQLIEVTKEEGMEGARDVAEQLSDEGKGLLLNQFSNKANPLAHFSTTGPEIWEQTRGKVTHFVSSMGTTGTIMGCSTYLKSKNPEIEVIGLQPKDGASIPGIRRWPAEYLPEIFEKERVNRVLDISQEEAESTMLALAEQEGIFCGVSSGGAVAGALKVAAEVDASKVENAIIVAIICDRGDRYLSTGIFADAGKH